MNFGLSLFLTFITLFLINQLCHADPIYKWTDENGKVHYGDKPKDIDKTEIYKEKDLPSISTVKSKSIYVAPSRIRRNKSSSQRKSEVSQCAKLKNKINDIEKQLRRRLTPGQHITYSNQLDDLRWKKIKAC